jgi:hypothetical protein
MLVAHNTLADLDGAVIAIGTGASRYDGSIEGLTIVNNILASASAPLLDIRTPLPPSVVIDNDLLWSGGPLASLLGQPTGDASTLRAWGIERDGLVGAPLFVDPVGGDYRLRAGSPAIDAARPVAGVNEVHAGAAPDIGRFEWTP